MTVAEAAIPCGLRNEVSCKMHLRLFILLSFNTFRIPTDVSRQSWREMQDRESGHGSLKCAAMGILIRYLAVLETMDYFT